MFNKLLIANRGEIACRVMKTARRLGMSCVAVYSDADARAMHVAMADEAYRLGPPPARDSYLDIAAIVDAARRSGAEAVHPGYGFLSENPALAEACAAAEIVFVGPPPAAMRAMGSKSESKRLMEEAQVPLLPGYHGEEQSAQRLRAAADAIGYPVLLKASAGGGGRGMRIVTHPGEFEEALAGARRESSAAFGDDRMLVEAYISEPRHVEVQVFGDRHGNMVHLFERDCSAQRRYQKIIEEAPAPGVDGELRERICSAAVAAARAIGYVGAGTVEFLLDGSGHFYFMEMNTRLQVEHPVTELVTHEDLVEWQLKVAAGEPLPRRQEDLRIHGHAIEARLYAEDPRRQFMPSTGRLAHLRFPNRDPLVRVDSGVRSGDEISFYYDPMIAKLIAWGDTREQAAERLAHALRDTEVVGVTANAAFLANLVSHPEFVVGGITTGFVAERGSELLGSETGPDDDALGTAALALLLERRARAARAAAASADPHSPWNADDSWRLNHVGETVLTFRHRDTLHAVRARADGPGFRLILPSGAELAARGELLEPPRLVANLGGVAREVSVVRVDDAVTVLVAGRRHELSYHDPGAIAAAQEVVPGSLSAPMPGKIIAVHVAPGERVRRGATLMVMEAMKMEHSIVAPTDGVVEEVRFQVGDLVDEDAELAVIATL